MYFRESEVIANENPDLHDVVERIDHFLATIFADAPLRPGDFACTLGCDTNQVIAIFDLLVEHDVLFAQPVVECLHCQNLMDANAYRRTCADGDSLDCSSCGCTIHRRSPISCVYRMSAETLVRPRPATPTADVEAALRVLDQAASVFCRMGQIWVIKYECELILMEDARGLAYLARLLSDPGRAVPAVSLLAAIVGIDPRITSGSSGQLLDDQSSATYKQRYADLHEELEVAQSTNDLGRVDQVRSELDAIETEIARATGLGGRKRELTDIDKVRRSVSMAVTRAIDSIYDEHSVLGRHLRNSVLSGLTFQYLPERPIDWVVK